MDGVEGLLEKMRLSEAEKKSVHLDLELPGKKNALPVQAVGVALGAVVTAGDY
jgi:hypothetical protein